VQHILTLSLAVALTLSATASPTPAPPAARRAPLAQQAAEEPQSAAELLALIRDKEDATPSARFTELAQIGTREAFINLKTALGYLRKSGPLGNASRAFKHFAGKGELETDAIGFLFQRIFNAGREEEQLAAALGLVQFKNALPELEEVLLRHRDPKVRAQVMRPLIPILGERGDSQSLELILNNAAIGGYQRKSVVAALTQFPAEQHTGTFLARLEAPDLTDAWRHLLLDTLGPRQGADITTVLLDLTRSDDLTFALHALTLLGQRCLPGGADASSAVRRRLLKPLLGFVKRDDAPALLAAATPILAETYALDLDRVPSSWRDTVKKLRRSKQPHRRRAACSALAISGTPEDVDKLLELLSDRDWSVRAAAVQAAAGLRLKRTLPPIIALLEESSGRTRKDCVRALRLLTGLDHGTAAARWNTWWEKEGAAFRLPALDTALAAEQARLARAAASTTKTSFYGLRIVSNRVAFILDMSGSMNAQVKGEGKTRRAIALAQVTQAVNALAEGTVFNVIFFATAVYPWMDTALPLDKRTRAAAISFIERQTLTGGTNIYDALLFALEDPGLDTLFVMSDGMPSGGSVNDIATIRAEIAAQNAARGIVIHGIAVGQKSALLKSLAQDSGGSYREVL
jgi:HEAT repeat protein